MKLQDQSSAHYLQFVGLIDSRLIHILSRHILQGLDFIPLRFLIESGTRDRSCLSMFQESVNSNGSRQGATTYGAGAVAVDCPLFATLATSAGALLVYGEIAAAGTVVENCRHGCRQGKA